LTDKEKVRAKIQKEHDSLYHDVTVADDWIAKQQYITPDTVEAQDVRIDALSDEITNIEGNITTKTTEKTTKEGEVTAAQKT
jgi:hypothetical protein